LEEKVDLAKIKLQNGIMPYKRISKKLEKKLQKYLSKVNAPRWKKGITWKENSLIKINSFH